MRQNKWVLPLLFCVIFGLTLLVKNFSTNSGIVIAAQENRPQLIMSTTSDYPPFNYRDTTQGSDQIIGFNIDLATAIVDRLGFKIEVLDTDFNGIIPALQSHRADFSVVSMVPTPERKQNVDFSHQA